MAAVEVAMTDTEVSDENVPVMANVKNQRRDRIVTLNVGGLRFQTRRRTLKRFPNTLLGSEELENYYVPERREYFFDRSRLAFEPILYYYQSNGIICLPSFINPDIFVEELKFFKLGEGVVRKFNSAAVMRRDSVMNDKFRYPLQKAAWLLFDDPNSGSVAKCIGYFDQIVILLAVAAQCIESLPAIRDPGSNYVTGSLSVSSVVTILEMTEVCSIAWFTLMFVIRATSCPSKKEFAKSLLNWLDLLAVLPFYLELVLKHSKPFLAILRFFRTIRIVRIFKMSRYFQGLFALGHSLSASAGELLLLALMLATFMVLFSSLIFFTESCESFEDCQKDPTNQFSSVVSGFWWSIVTMSTVGYGDAVPKTPLGKVVGSLCALTGILVISLPFPLIITNFNKFMRFRYSKSKEYATIADGLGEEAAHHIPEYTGVAYGFFNDDDHSIEELNNTHNINSYDPIATKEEAV